MSTTIDQRVIEMRFDNKHFEQNVSTTMSTLDKLKQKLNLDGAAKGLDGVNAAAKNVNLSGLGNAVDTVQAKFSAMQVIGVTALANITNSAVNAGKRMVKALTIEPITTGFKEYETQINATQTILANTKSKGSDINDVNKALEELNKYADLTIYNFTEMTRNIGTFTAAGIDLDTSVNAIQGIANLAAVSGSTSQQASTAMYQLSQALAAGTIRLMDWNSVVNAGMGGEVFQNALKETSRELGTGADKAIKASGSFRESLKDGWLTADVLTATLKKFTSSGANEYVAKYIGQSPDVVEAALKEGEAAAKAAGAVDEEAFAIEHASKALAEKYGKNADEIKQTLEFAQTATDAATKVKTFTQLWDVLKESAQSGWAQTWKILVGDFEEAKNLITPLADVLTSIIGKVSDWRNAILESALGKGLGAIGDNLNKLIKPASKAMEVVKDTADSIAKLDKIARKVIRGDFGNGQERIDKLTKAGFNYCEVQNRVNKKLGSSFRYTKEQIAAQDKLIGKQQESTKKTEEQSDATVKLTKEQKEQLKQFAAMDEAQAKSKGYTDEQIKAMQELGETANKLGLPMDEFIDNLDQINGRWLLINSFKNIGQGIVHVFNAMKDAWQSIFPPKSIEERGEQLFNIIAAFHKFTSILEGNSDTAEKLRRTFAGVFAIVDMITTVLGGGFKIAFKVVSSILSYFNLDILDVTASIGDAVVRFHDWFESLFDLSGVLDKIMPYVEKFGSVIGEWFGQLKGINLLDKFVEYIAKAKNALVGWLTSFNDTESVADDIIAGLIGGLRSGVMKVWNAALEIGKSILESIKSFLGIHSPSTEMKEVGTNVIDGFILGIQNGASKIWSTLKGLFSGVVEWAKKLDFGAIFAAVMGIGVVSTTNKVANALEAFTAPIGGLGDLFEGVGKVLAKSARPIKKILNNTAKVVQSFSKVLNSVAFNIRMEGIKTLVQSILMLVGAIIVLTFFDPTELWNAVGVIFALAVILGVLAFAMNKISGATASFDLKEGLNIQGLSTGLMGIGAAILLMAVTVKMIGNLDPEQAKQGFLGLAGLVVAIAGVIAAFGLLTKGDSAKNIDKLGSTMLKLSVALLMMVAVVKLVSKLTDDELISGAIFVGGFTAFVLALSLIGLIPGNNIDKFGGMMLKISTALILMIGVVKLAAGLSEPELIAGAKFLAGFAAFVGILALIGGLGGKSIDGVGKMMLSLSVSMLLLVGVCKLIGMLSPEEMRKGLVAIGIMTAIIYFFTESLSKLGAEMPKAAGTILAFSLAIGILAAVSIVCGLISVEGLAKGLVAVGLLSLMITSMIAATRGANDVKGNIYGIAVAIGVMVAAVALLTFIDPTKLAIATTVMTVLLGMFAVVVKVAGMAQTAMGTIIAMTVAIAAIGTVLYVLSKLPVDSVLNTAMSLSIVMLTLVGTLAILTLIGPAATAALPAMGMLAALVGVLAAILLALGGLSKIDGFNELIADGGATLSLIGKAIGAFVGSIVSGFAAEVLTILPVFGMALSGFMAGVQPFIAGAKMIDASVLAGVGMLSAAIIALSVADFISGVMTLGGIGLIGLGATLSGFMVAASGFFAGAANINPESMAGIKSLADAILVLTAANVIDGITSLFGGGNALDNFATQLPILGQGLAAFSTSLGTFSEDQLATVKCAAEAVKTLAQAANEIPNTGGLLGQLVGDNDLGPFAAQFPILGTGLASFLTNIGTFTDDQVATVTCAADAIKTLAQASSEIPNTGGLLGQLVGENDLATFAEQFPVLGTGLAGFLANIGTFTEEQGATVTCAADAIKSLAQAASEIPNSGGWVGAIVGNNDLGTFAEQFPVLGTGLRGFIDNVGVFTDAQVLTISAVVRAINALAGLANSDLKGATKHLTDFGGDLPEFASDVGEFCSNMPSTDSMSAAISNLDRLLAAVQAIGNANSGCLATFADNLKKVGEKAVKKFVEAFTSSSAKEDLKNAAVKLGEKVVEGIEDKEKAIKTAGENAAKKAVDGVETQDDDMESAGKDLGSGLVRGINSKKTAAYNAGYALGQMAVQGEKDGQKSNSPSKLTTLAGQWLGEGLIIGMKNVGNSVYKAGNRLGDSATNSVSSTISNIASLVNTDIDSQPTIRPVMDLSEIRTGAAAISGMFNNSAAIGVQANVSAISSMMNSRGQNGVNTDVVSAIDKLRKDLSNVGGNTYSINGINVSEGTDAADAIHTLVRVIKMEGRS